MSSNRVNRTARKFAVETKASRNPGKARKQDGVVTSGKRTGIRSSESLSCPVVGTTPAGNRKFNFWENGTRTSSDWMITGLIDDE